MDFYWHHESYGASPVVYVAPGQQVKAHGRKVLPLHEHPAIIENRIIASFELPADPKSQAPAVDEKAIAILDHMRRYGPMSLQQMADYLGISHKQTMWILTVHKKYFVKTGKISNQATKRPYFIYDLVPEAKRENFTASLQRAKPKREPGQLINDVTGILRERGPMTISEIATALGASTANIYNALSRNESKFEHMDKKRWRLINAKPQ